MDELKTRTSISQVVGRKVMWDTRKSNQGKGDLWAPCPFHQEKTASFHVDDRKGYYYCFGCQAKGDALKFVQETENVSFMEAVEILAGEAGMTMPERDPQAREKADKRTQVLEVVAAAQKFFRLSLRTGAGGAARDYLARRGLSEEAQERFGIGFAPDGWQALWDHLQGKGIAAELIFDAGLAKPSTKGGKPYDTFRNRIMFPINDPRGRPIAFGGRAMDPNDNAKYLNSPETLLFDKSRVLYNHGPAREAAGKGQPLVVSEGYMDVIALSEGGFGAAVAPLGTAVTEHHLAMLWRITDEPIIALDGDTAGLRAAHRVIDLALPLLQSGKSLRFALMPEGKDPDDLIRAEGAGAVQKLLDTALPMVQLLWRRETEGRVFDSPERKAGLDKALRDKTQLIQDPALRGHYDQELKDLKWQLFRGNRTSRSGPKRGRPFDQVDLPPVATTKASMLVAAGDHAQIEMREAVILAALLSTPSLIEEFEPRLEVMTFVGEGHGMLQDALLRCISAAPQERHSVICAQMGRDPLETLMAARHVAIVPCLRRPGDVDMARLTVADELAKLEAQRGLAAEIAEAEEDLTGLPNEAVTYRLGQAAEARHRAERSEHEDTAEYDKGPNGVLIDRDERNRLDALLEQISYSKRR